MAAVTTARAALAGHTRCNRGAGLIGGFLTPFLLRRGGIQVGLFTYVALLDGVRALANSSAGAAYDFMSFAGTALMFFGWLVINTGRKLWPTVFPPALLHQFAAARRRATHLPRRPIALARHPDVSAERTCYVGTTYAMLDGRTTTGFGSFALVVSAFFVLLYYAAWSRHREDVLLSYSYLGAAATFAAIAVAVQLDLHWVTIGWSVEALMLVWVGLRAGESAARHAALAVFAVALAHWFGWDVDATSYREGAAFVPLLNRRALSCAALVGALAGAAWLHRREGRGCRVRATGARGNEKGDKRGRGRG